MARMRMKDTRIMESKVSRRLRQATAPEICEYIYEPRLAREFASGFAYLTQINQAHLLMLRRAGLLAPQAAAQLARVLRQMEREGPAAVPLDPQREDAYFNYEARLIELAGVEAGGRLHIARSRNDILATHDRLRARDAGLALMDAVCDAWQRALDGAREYAGVVMPGYTHLQAAQPITYGYYLAAVAETLGRDLGRLEAALAGLEACPLGAGALAGTAFPIQREETARLLGFAACTSNALDSVASRDFAWELLAAMTVAAVTWSRVAQDFYVWSTPEFGLIEFPDSVAGTSSIMPQKKNPVVLEYLKGKAGHMIGLQAAALSSVKESNFTHTGHGNRESMRSFWEAAQECERGARLFGLVLGAARPLRAHMEARARQDFSMATDLADALVRQADVSFRQAHHIVGAVVRQALDQGLPADAITAQMIDAAGREQLGRPMGLDPQTVARCLDPVAGVAARAVPGGPAPERVAARAREQDDALRAARQRLAARRAALAQAARSREQALEALAAG